MAEHSSKESQQLDFVGRERELSALQDTFDMVQGGKGRTVLISGEAGIGKTTFVERFVEMNEKLKFFSSNCSHYEHPRPYQPFSEIANELLREEREATKQSIIKSALQPVEDVRDVDTEMAKDNIYGAFLDVFERNTSSSKPLFIFIDDLQWADTSSLHLFHYLSRNVRKAPMLLCGTYRPEYISENGHLNEVVTRLKHEKLVEYLELDRLTRDKIERLAQGITERRDDIFRITEGNPLFVEKILETRENEENAKISLPESVKDLVLHRLDDLSFSAEKVLKMSAVIGNEFRGRLLQKMFDDIDIFLDGIEELVRKRIIREKRGKEEEVYEFDHKMIRKTVYEDLTRNSRRVRHREIGKKLEKFIQEDEDIVYDLSRHFYLGKVNDKSLEYSLKAARKAEDVYAHEDALKFYSHALESIEKVDEDVKAELSADKTDIQKNVGEIYRIIGEYGKAVEHFQDGIELTRKDEERAELYAKMAKVLLEEGKYEEALEYCEDGLSLLKEDNPKRGGLLNKKGWTFIRWGDYDEAIEVFKEELDLAKRLDEKGERGESLHALGTAYLRKGDYDRAEDFLLKAIDIRDDLNDNKGLSGSLNNIGIIYYHRGELDKALEHYQRGLEIDEDMGYKSDIASSLNNIGLIYRDKGELDKALEYSERSLEIKEEIGDRHSFSLTLGNIGFIYHYKGELDKSLDYYERSLDIAEDIGDKHGIALSLNNIGNLYLSKEELDKALEYYKRSLDVVDAIGDKEGIAATLSGLAETQLRKGDVQEAKDNAEEALQTAMDMSAKMEEGISQRVLAMVHKEEGNWSGSEKEFQRAIEKLKEGGDREELAETYLEYGLMWKEKSEEKKAEKHLKKARSIFEEMGMELWVEKTEEGLGSLR